MSPVRSTALQDVNFWGTMAVAAGDADGMVSGCAVHPNIVSACWQPALLSAALAYMDLTLGIKGPSIQARCCRAVHTTAATIRPGLQVLRSKAVPLVSSVFFMLLPDKVRPPRPPTLDQAWAAPV